MTSQTRVGEGRGEWRGRGGGRDRDAVSGEAFSLNFVGKDSFASTVKEGGGGGSCL